MSANVVGAGEEEDDDDYGDTEMSTFYRLSCQRTRSLDGDHSNADNALGAGVPLSMLRVLNDMARSTGGDTASRVATLGIAVAMPSANPTTRPWSGIFRGGTGAGANATGTASGTANGVRTARMGGSRPAATKTAPPQQRPQASPSPSPPPATIASPAVPPSRPLPLLGAALFMRDLRNAVAREEADTPVVHWNIVFALWVSRLLPTDAEDGFFGCARRWRILGAPFITSIFAAYTHNSIGEAWAAQGQHDRAARATPYLNNSPDTALSSVYTQKHCPGGATGPVACVTCMKLNAHYANKCDADQRHPRRTEADKPLVDLTYMQNTRVPAALWFNTPDAASKAKMAAVVPPPPGDTQKQPNKPALVPAPTRAPVPAARPTKRGKAGPAPVPTSAPVSVFSMLHKRPRVTGTMATTIPRPLP